MFGIRYGLAEVARLSGLAASAWTAALAAATLSAFALALLNTAAQRLPQAYPSARSLHGRPVPRVGGIAIWAGAVPIALAAPDFLLGRPVALAAWLAIAAVSLADDWCGVRPSVRLAVHAVAAAAMTALILPSGTPDAFSARDVLARVAAVVVLMWGANLYNFMDGSDGLAAVMAVCGFAAYASAAAIAGFAAHALVALAAASLPFLAVNLPPARTFMGDVGSVPLGFLAAAVGLAGIVEGAWPVWFPLLAFLPFVADATLTLLRRIARRERVFEAHRAHYYQRLNRAGAGHAGTLLVFGALVAGTSTSAVLAAALAPHAGWPLLAAWSGAIGLLFAGIDYHWRKRIGEDD
jgi:UDP-N-acetylmuramyl pentapeptide phosphotransferase/UDP-N-acetylglucosamine-1-phosphate transferase